MEYIKKELEEEHVYNRPFLQRLSSALSGYTVFHRLDVKEAEALTLLGETPYMIRIRTEEINYGLFALELLTLHIEHLTINVSKKKILKYKADSVMDLLKLKQKDSEVYTKVQKTVKDSRLSAKMMYHYTKEYINEL